MNENVAKKYSRTGEGVRSRVEEERGSKKYCAECPVVGGEFGGNIALQRDSSNISDKKIFRFFSGCNEFTENRREICSFRQYSEAEVPINVSQLAVPF